ncbi:uroporphyrinogen-III synthase [Photobacterium sanctipauli]|uniref:Uroporphyrinogen-III synthase n=1 Tax=Photobacterium sanctipauli TaxID=1342794 RepID=A0A2T3NES5_9GAMM|nr:uroporphyrinogen-III synthase [Photobacterium sanctipauli]PSW13073.1 uroporphyrinogen-III synthase [Photobacterium sanctipauli]
MTVLITRPAPDCHQLAEQLDAAGISAIAQPLLEIQPGQQLNQLISSLQQLKAGDFLIAVSVHAINLAHNYLLSVGASWPKNVHYIAVGHKTAAMMKTCTAQPVITPVERYDSEGVLALPELASVDAKRILILRGNGGRELMYQALAQRGAYVSYCETYQRSWLPLDGRALCQQWQREHVSKLVITSGEQLNHLAQLVPDDAKAWFYQCHLFVPSQRIADQAKQLGFNTISTVGSAANGPLLTTLSKIGTMGKSDD